MSVCVQVRAHVPARADAAALFEKRGGTGVVGGVGVVELRV